MISNSILAALDYMIRDQQLSVVAPICAGPRILDKIRKFLENCQCDKEKCRCLEGFEKLKDTGTNSSRGRRAVATRNSVRYTICFVAWKMEH